VVVWSGVALSLMWIPVLARYGVTGTLGQVEAWQHIMATTTPPWALQHFPQGLPTMLLALVYPPRTIPTGEAMTWAQLVAVALFVGAVVWKRPAGPLLFVLCALATALLSPLAWRANFVLAWPLLWALLAGLTRVSPRAAWGTAAFLLVFSIVVHDVVWGMERFITLLYVRPFGVVFTALFVLGLVWGRSPPRSPVQSA